MKTVVEGGRLQLEAALDTILAGGTPNIQFIIESQKGYWIIIHVA
jgi:hypothetical protein